MAGNARKQQKKLERRTAKRKAHSREVTRRREQSFGDRLAAADRYPLVDCTVSDSMDANGIGWVCVSRELPSGGIAYAIFLVDRYCLGVKNVITDVAGRFDYEDNVARKLHPTGEMPSQRWELPAARKLVEGAVAYAAQFGFAPHREYREARAIFGSADPATCPDTFEYGKDGKPFYVNGPDESLSRQRQIIASLEKHCGPGKYHVMVVGDDTRLFGEPLDDDDRDDPAALPPQV